MAWNPAAPNAGTHARHVYRDCGKPCSRRTRGPSAGPASSAANVPAGVVIAVTGGAYGRPGQTTASSRLAQELDQAAGVPTLAAALFDLRVELIDEGGERQPAAEAVGLGEAEAEVLAHPLHGEAEVELAGGHRRRPVVHLPALGGALADDVEHLGRVEPGAQREVDGLGEALHHAGDADLVDHLGELAGAGGSHPLALHRVRVNDRVGPLEVGLRVGAAHH